MKIQGINNQTNISHKAYFKPNQLFDALYNTANKTKDLAMCAARIKQIHPNQELEITKLSKIKGFYGDIYEITNNTTKKTLQVTTNKGETGLIGILGYLNLYRDSDFFKEKLDINCECYDILTKKD